jgi:hypothetical protein
LERRGEKDDDNQGAQLSWSGLVPKARYTK